MLTVARLPPVDEVVAQPPPPSPGGVEPEDAPELDELEVPPELDELEELVAGAHLLSVQVLVASRQSVAATQGPPST